MDGSDRLALAIAGQIYQRGKLAGAEEERARVSSALDPNINLRRLRSNRYGTVSPPVLRAVRDLAHDGSPDGINAKDVLSRLEAQGNALNSTQVRTAMKYLLSIGRLRRGSRGRYFPTAVVVAC